MGKVTILETTTRNPITLIGERAGICWGADTTDAAKNYKRGWDCITSGHGRTLEMVNVEMVLDGYSARVIREWYTHIGGAPTRLQASTRYIDYGDFDYITPPSIAQNESMLCEWQSIMQTISNAMSDFEKAGVPREDIAMLLPLGMSTRVVDKRNLRNLIDMSRQRLCNRAYWEFQQLMDDICDALREVGPEWGTIIDTQFMPKCKAAGFCTEKHGCGMMPKRGEAEK